MSIAFPKTRGLPSRSTDGVSAKPEAVPLLRAADCVPIMKSPEAKSMKMRSIGATKLFVRDGGTATTGPSSTKTSTISTSVKLLSNVQCAMSIRAEVKRPFPVS